MLDLYAEYVKHHEEGDEQPIKRGRGAPRKRCIAFSSALHAFFATPPMILWYPIPNWALREHRGTDDLYMTIAFLDSSRPSYQPTDVPVVPTLNAQDELRKCVDTHSDFLTHETFISEHAKYFSDNIADLEHLRAVLLRSLHQRHGPNQGCVRVNKK